MDFPVEATIHTSYFQDASEVLHILRSHGFQMWDLGPGLVRVRGDFSKLVEVQARLEELRRSQTRTTPSSPERDVSQGAVPKYHNNNRKWPDHRDQFSHPSSPSASYHRASVSPAPSRPGTESFVIDADVFRYAKQLRKKDIDTILNCHNVEMHEQKSDESTIITLQGRSSKIAMNKLQDILGSLTKSLRTQEVPRTDMGHEGTILLEKIRKDKLVYGSVLVCEMSDRLHLIGPSGESYELKQRLMGRKSDVSGRTGRSLSKNQGRRSSSLPPNRSSTARENSSRARGFSPQRTPPPANANYANANATAAPQAQRGAQRRRSFSDSNVKETSHPGGTPEKEKKQNQAMKFLQPLMSLKDKKPFFRPRKQ